MSSEYRSFLINSHLDLAKPFRYLIEIVNGIWFHLGRREGDERIIWMIQEGRFCKYIVVNVLFLHLHILSVWATKCHLWAKIFYLFYLLFLFLNIQPLRCSKVGRKRQNNSWEFWDISCGFCPHIDKWQTPLLSVFCTWEIRKKRLLFQ